MDGLGNARYIAANQVHCRALHRPGLLRRIRRKHLPHGRPRGRRGGPPQAPRRAAKERLHDSNDSFPTGSVPKGTALKSHADLDIMVVLHYGKHIKGKKPSQVLTAVQKALSEYRTGVRRNGQAVTLYYKSWPNVDVVPVSRVDNNDGTVSHYNVPNMNNETWIESRPRRHANSVAAKANECGARFLPLVRMVKEWNRTHSELLSLYHIEVIALQACSGLIGDYPWAVYVFFDRAIGLAEKRLWYEGAWADDYLDADTRAEAVKRLKTVKDRANTAGIERTAATTTTRARSRCGGRSSATDSPRMANGIPQAQNEDRHLRQLAAQRAMYSRRRGSRLARH